MKAGPIEIGRLLQNRQRFCVPIYQRHYVWSREKQLQPFWDDIRTKAIECLDGRERRFSHFMGAVVLEARGNYSAGRIPTFQVVDGQQRLTTFQIFLAAARDYAIISGFSNSAERISDYLLNDKPHLMQEPNVEILKVWPTQYDRSLFIDIIRTNRAELRKKYYMHFYANKDKIYNYKSVPNLLSGYGFFFEKIMHAVESDDLDGEFSDSTNNDQNINLPNQKDREIKFDAIWQALVEEFKVVEIVLEDGDDAQVIFETLNERGQPLLAADLIRNNIFQRAEAAGENAEELFASHWKFFEDAFWEVEEKQGRYKKARIEFFLTNFLAAKIAGEINLSKIFSEYKSHLKASYKSKLPRYKTVVKELEDLVKYGKIYKEIIERSSGTSLATFSVKLQPWDVTTLYPLVLRIWASAELESTDKDYCLKTLLNLIIRRHICGLTAKNYNKFFLSVLSHLDEQGWSKSNFTQFLLDNKAESGRFPRDEEFKEKWLYSPSYSLLQPSRTRAVLEEIELVKRTRFHETDQLSENLTVEHVLPRNWSEFWPLTSGEVPTPEQLHAAYFTSIEDDSITGKIVRRKRLLQNFGNLTILTQPLNSSVSNGPYNTKKKYLEAHSLLVLNREITKSEIWNEETIIKRSESLYDVAIELWPLPTLD